MGLIGIAIAPVLIIAFYIYLRDKYEREPLKTILIALISGCGIVFPVIFVERLIGMGSMPFYGLSLAAYEAFAVAAFTEELFKLLAFMLIIWRLGDFNEKFDGIVYAVYISLGFALVENILYVINYGMSVGFIRAFTAVPAHALFGVIMGYQLGQAKFYPREKLLRIFFAFLMPFILHGIYDFILMSEYELYMLFFLPYLIFLWLFGFRRIKSLSERSVFRWISKKK